MMISKFMVATQRPSISKHCLSYLSQDAPPSRPILRKRIMYSGKLIPKINILKGVSLTSSATMIGTYSYMIAQKGLGGGVLALGFISLPFVLSPIVIAWFCRRYICELSYDPATQKYTAIKFGYLFDRKKHTINPKLVKRTPLSLINTFEVGKEKFFIDPEELKDAESVKLYKSLVGLDKEETTSDRINIKE